MAHEIPVVDLAGFLAGGDGTPAAAAIEAAATQVGFFQVVGHGVPADLLDAVYRAARSFAGLDADTKRQCRSAHPYRGVHLRPDATGTVRLERFLAARYDDPASAVAAGVDPALADYYHPNVWPADPPARSLGVAMAGWGHATARARTDLGWRGGALHRLGRSLRAYLGDFHARIRRDGPGGRHDVITGVRPTFDGWPTRRRRLLAGIRFFRNLQPPAEPGAADSCISH